MSDATASEALRYANETRDMLREHLKDCADYRKEMRQGIEKINRTLTEWNAIRHEREHSSERKLKRTNLYIAMGGVAIASIGAINLLMSLYAAASFQ